MSEAFSVGSEDLFSVFSGWNVAAEGFDVGGESVASPVGDAADRLRHLSLEPLGHFDVPGLLQLVELHAQVARCRSRLGFQVDEVCTVSTDQDGHDRQAKLRMEQGIQGHE